MKRICIVVAIATCCLWAWPSLPSAFQSGPFPDFDEDGVVGFADFLQFAGRFGSARGEESYDDRFDLNGDGSIGFPDFLIFAGSFGKASPYAGDENDVLIPDANLRAVIADSLGKPRDAPITRAEMETLTHFQAPGANIRHIIGLQFAVNLKELWLQDNAITDLSPLCDLTELTDLVLYSNKISDISTLSNLVNLHHLNLSHNKVYDISVLAELTDLGYLGLADSQISDFSTLSNLTNLIGLWIGNSGIADLSVLDGLTELKELDLDNNNVSDVSALAGLRKLTLLRMSNNKIAVASGLSGLTNLIGLDISGTGIADLSVLANLTKLTNLNLSGNCISDITALFALTNLTRLDLSDNRIKDFSPLVRNSGIDSGDIVDTRDNPSSPESIQAHLIALRMRGVNVQYDDKPESVCIPVLPDDMSVDAGSSHTLQANHLHVDREGIRPEDQRGRVHAVAYLDFNEDGHLDVFLAPLDDTPNKTPAEFYQNDGAGCFSLATGFFDGNPPGQVHPRKALHGDFNGDGRMDVFVLGHGYDQPPFPGEAPYVILSSPSGYVLGEGLDAYVGFQHGGASADIDGDGDIDVFVTHLNATDGPFFLINDGSGSFVPDTDRVEGLAHKALFTAELVDVDGDGFLDLLAAGHEYDPPQDLQTQILWGDTDGVYSTDNATILPAVQGRGIVVDVDVSDTDGDGDKDIVINRTGDERTSTYDGYYLQLVEQVNKRRFEDRTKRLLSENEDAEATWFDWVRMCDCDSDGDVDIVVDDAARKLIWKNDGTGRFHRR